MKYVRNMVWAVILSIFWVNMVPVISFAARANEVEIKTEAINYPLGGYDVQKAQIFIFFRKIYILMEGLR